VKLGAAQPLLSSSQRVGATQPPLPGGSSVVEETPPLCGGRRLSQDVRRGGPSSTAGVDKNACVQWAGGTLGRYGSTITPDLLSVCRP